MSFSVALNPNRLLLWAVIFFFGLSYVAQIQHDSAVHNRSIEVTVAFNELIEPQPLSPAATRAASFGSNEFAADIYWLKLIQYYGGGDPAGRYRKLAELYNTVTDLSPKFMAAYLSGLLVLPGEGFVNEALMLGEKGRQNLPESWEMPYYTGLVYHIYKKDYVRAATEFTAAAELPGAPANTKLFVALYYKEADQRRLAYELFKTLYETATDDFIKDRALKYVGHMDGIFALEDAVANFQTRFKRLPSSLNELVEQKILPTLPVSPFGFEYRYDNATGKINDGK